MLPAVIRTSQPEGLWFHDFVTLHHFTVWFSQMLQNSNSRKVKHSFVLCPLDGDPDLRQTKHSLLIVSCDKTTAFVGDNIIK